MAKTNWQMGDTVQPADMNDLGEEINQLRTDVDNIHIPPATLTEAGIVKLNNAINSTSNTDAATPSAVKQAYDLAGTANNKADQAFQLGNERKQELVDVLIAKGISASTSESWDSLLSKAAAIIKSTGNASPAEVLSGSTFSNQTSNGLTGNMPNRSAENYHMPGLESTVWPGDRFFIRPPDGYFNGSTWVTAAVPGLTAANLRAGVNVAGLIGTLIEGKRSASGVGIATGSNEPSDWIRFDAPTGYWRNCNFLQISGISFTPSVLILLGGASSSGVKGTFTIYYRDMQLNGTANANIIVGDLWSGYQPTNNYVFLSSGNAYVDSTGFRLPVNYGSGIYSWFAIE